MRRNAAVWDPRLPQNYPTAPTGPLTLCLVPPLTNFGLDFLLLAFPYATICVSPFLPTLKKSRPWGCGIFNWFMGSSTQALGAVAMAACPSSVAGSDPTAGQRVPKLLPHPLPWNVCAGAATPSCFA